MQAISNPVVDKPKRYQCRHIFTDGHRCGSPCLRGEELCYYHHTTRKPTTGARRRRCRRSAFDLPLPEDRSAIQSSIGQVLQRIASNDIDPRRAGLLLYGLQIASLNLPRDPAPSRAAEAETVEEIVLDPALGTLAPRSEAGREASRRSPVAALIDQMGALGVAEDSLNASEPLQATTPPTEAPAKDLILPILQAAAGKLNDRVPARPHHSKRCQILILVTMSERKIPQAIPGNLLELLRCPQRSPADLPGRVRRKPRRGLLQQRNQTLHTKVSSSMPSLHHTLGYQKQLRPGLKRLHRRLMRQMGKQPQRYRGARQNPRTFGVMKHSSHATRIHVSKNPKRKIVATDKCRREVYTMRSSEQLVIDLLHQLRGRIHHIRARLRQKLRASVPKRILNLCRNRSRRLFGSRNIGQQENHMRAKVYRVEEVPTRPHRMILRMQIKALQPVQLHTTWSSADLRRLRLRRHHGILQPTNLFAIVTPCVTDWPSEGCLHHQRARSFERSRSIAKKRNSKLPPYLSCAGINEIRSPQPDLE
jgi:hypothetical protein